MFFDWHQFHLDELRSPAMVDSRRRLRVFLGGFLLALLVVLGRAVQLELSEGATFRAVAARPLRHESSLPAARGRILARDGTVLAHNEEVLPDEYPGAKIVRLSRRAYPNGSLAGCLLGHLGRVTQEEMAEEETPADDDGYRADDLIGRMGVERQYESLLRGRRGVTVTMTNHSGRVVATERLREPIDGDDLVLTLDPALQRAAESLLDDALRRRRLAMPDSPPAGGAIVVLDVHNGELLVAASAPTFDPNVFSAGDSGERAALLDRPDHPLFDRSTRMALPPGGVFKTLAAVALLETATVRPDESFFCQGYLHRPDRLRCEIYLRQGVGHGDVTLADALAQNCDVAFFHHAGRLGSRPLIDWADRFGFGRPTGVDLPGEAAGVLPDVEHNQGPATPGADALTSPPIDGDAMLLAIGQGELTATPLQVARLMAAVANGGQLVTPHLLRRIVPPQGGINAMASEASNDGFLVQPPRPIAGLHAETLATIGEGLRRAVAETGGAAHDTVRLDAVEIAGVPGTAESVGGDHAWFAGYVPADRPRFALVVALEHAGTGPTAAGPLAQRLVRRMQQLEMF